MKVTMFTLFAALTLISSCDSQKTAGNQVCDESMSLRTDCVFKTPKALAAPVFSQTMPGESTKIARAYVTAPPLIPHSIEGITVDATMNGCLMCHNGAMEGAPSVPKSHKTEAVVKYSQSQKPQVTQVKSFVTSKGEIDLGRYVCLTCHVPKAGNLKPLVINQF